MKDIMTSGILVTLLLLTLIFAAPILNEAEKEQQVLSKPAQEVVNENSLNNDITVKSKIHTPL